jgi:hypothetical protein
MRGQSTIYPSVLRGAARSALGRAAPGERKAAGGVPGARRRPPTTNGSQAASRGPSRLPPRGTCARMRAAGSSPPAPAATRTRLPHQPARGHAAAAAGMGKDLFNAAVRSPSEQSRVLRCVACASVYMRRRARARRAGTCAGRGAAGRLHPGPAHANACRLRVAPPNNCRHRLTCCAPPGAQALFITFRETMEAAVSACPAAQARQAFQRTQRGGGHPPADTPVPRPSPSRSPGGAALLPQKDQQRAPEAARRVGSSNKRARQPCILTAARLFLQ